MHIFEKKLLKIESSADSFAFFPCVSCLATENSKKGAHDIHDRTEIEETLKEHCVVLGGKYVIKRERSPLTDFPL